MNSPTFDAIRAVLIEQFHVDAGSIGPQVALDQLGLDSLALMEFVFAVEDRFGTRIPEERLDPRQSGLTLADVVAALEDRLAATPSTAARTDAPSPT